MLFGRELVGVFLDLDAPANQPVIALAVSFLVFAGIFQLADAGQAAASGMLRGLGDTRMPMVFAGDRLLGRRRAAGRLLGFWVNLEGDGIWIGLATGLAVVAGADDGTLDQAGAAGAHARN